MNAPNRRSADTDRPGSNEQDASLASPALSAPPQGEREAFEAAYRARFRVPAGTPLTYPDVPSAREWFEAGRASLRTSPAVPVAQDERETYKPPQNFCQQCSKTVNWSPCVTDGEAINCIIAAQSRAALSASTQPALPEGNLGYRVDWPDEPELGHFFAEEPVPGARNIALCATPPAVSAEATRLALSAARTALGDFAYRGGCSDAMLEGTLRLIDRAAMGTPPADNKENGK